MSDSTALPEPLPKQKIAVVISYAVGIFCAFALDKIIPFFIGFLIVMGCLLLIPALVKDTAWMEKYESLRHWIDIQWPILLALFFFAAVISFTDKTNEFPTWAPSRLIFPLAVILIARACSQWRWVCKLKARKAKKA